MRIALKISEIKLVLLLCVVFVSGAKAQNTAKFNFGVDYLLLNGDNSNYHGDEGYSSRGGLFAEKQFQIKKLGQVYCVPGLSVKKINEIYYGGGMGAGISRKLNHYSVSSSAKLIYKFDIGMIKPSALYAGGIGGVQLFTWAKGSASSYSVLYPEANWQNDNYKERPSRLFRRVYCGLVAGIEFMDKGLIRPAIEVRYFSRFANYQEIVFQPFELAVSIGIGKRESKEIK